MLSCESMQEMQPFKKLRCQKSDYTTNTTVAQKVVCPNLKAKSLDRHLIIAPF